MTTALPVPSCCFGRANMIDQRLLTSSVLNCNEFCIREKPPLGIHRPLTEPEVENWRMLVVVAAMMSTSQAQGLVWTETPGSPL